MSNRIPPRDTILICGGTTHANRGDRAMHAGLLRWLAENRPGLRPVFLASNPGETNRVLGVASEAAPDAGLAQPWNRQTLASTRQRWCSFARGFRFALSPGDFGRHLASAAAVWIPGSGSINSLWWHDWLHVKAWQALAARRAGVPVFATSQGVGPVFSHPMDSLAARLLFNTCRVAGVRDGEASAGLLRACGVHPDRLANTGDDALLWPPDIGAADRLLSGWPVDGPVVTLNLRDSSNYGKRYPAPDFGFWTQVIRGLADLPGRPNFLFVPISYDAGDDDRVPAGKIAAAAVAAGVDAARLRVVEEEVEAPVLRALAARADLALGISYHFLLFSLAAGVPALGFWQNAYYEGKIRGLTSTYGCPGHGFELAATDPREIVARARAMLADPAPVRNSLAANLDRLKLEHQSARDRILAHLPDFVA